MKTTILPSAANVALLLILVLQPPVAHAQGTAFTYQGQLQSGGAPASGTFNLLFALYTNSTGGTAAAGPLTNNAVFITNGLFTVTIDFGGSAWNGQTNWLQIAVETNGAGSFTALTPRQELTPAPYAIFAEGAQASGLSGTIPMSSLGGTYGGVVSLTNSGNSFTGNGAGLTNVTATVLGGLASSNFWQVGGNTGVATGANYIGNNDNQYLDLRANGVRALRLRLMTDGLGIYTNAPNVIGGSSVNLTAPNVVGATIAGGGGNDTNGFSVFNEVSADYGTIGGGNQNVASGYAATVSGGQQNTASGYVATVSAGQQNIASNTYATVSGGELNIAGGNGATVGGGGYDGTSTPAGNQAIGNASFVGGGLGNSIPGAGAYGVIGGGAGNVVSNQFATVAGGTENTANGLYATVGGGWLNTASGLGATVAGGGTSDFAENGNIASGSFATVGGGQQNTASGANSTVAGGYLNQANGATYGSAFVGGGGENTALSYATVSGGIRNNASGFGSTIGGGGFDGTSYAGNVASGNGAFIGGGLSNTNAGQDSAIGGGVANIITGVGSFIGGGGYDGASPGGNSIAANAAVICGGWGNSIPAGSRYAVIGGGLQNQAEAYYATVGGGDGNLAQAEGATVGGGTGNSAQGEYSTVPGGWFNYCYGAYSFAAGEGATASYNGSFVWGDNSGTDAGDTGANQFVARASGGFFFYTGTGPSGAKLASGATSWTTLCDRNAKKNFKSVDTEAVLNKLAAVPIEQWNYKWEKDGDVPNIGPMAQDFKAAFYPGRDDKGITTLEFDGVELAAIQGLNQKLQEKDTEIADLKARLVKLEQAVSLLTATSK